MHTHLDLTITVKFPYRLYFTNCAFSAENNDLARILEHRDSGTKAVVFMEEGLKSVFPELGAQIETWFSTLCPAISFCGIKHLPGGEAAKASSSMLERALSLLVETNIDRHSYLIGIGGGAFLDAVGLAAALAHRGVRLVRMPTTTLSQGDSGVGVKNGINFGGQKNYLGSFAVAWATLNDSFFLENLPPAIAREGLTEAIKVAIVQDEPFFCWIEERIHQIAALEPSAISQMVAESAALHARHIAESGDAFEQGSSRPLDFAHWSAHYLESMSGYSLSHGHAVSIGICLDLFYSVKKGWLSRVDARRAITCLKALGMPLSHPLMEEKDESGAFQLLRGLDAFREHLGGELTILMLKGIGIGEDIHEVDLNLMSQCIQETADSSTHPLLEE